MRGSIGSVDAGTPFDDVEVELQNALLAEGELGDGDEGELGAFAEDGAAGAEEDVLDELLRDRGASAEAAAFHVGVGSELDGVPVEAVMLIEARVLGGNDGMLEIG